MELDDDVQIEGTVTDYLIQQITDEEHGKDFAAEYLKSVFLETTVNDLFYVRRQAGLTQAQVAEKMKTKQAAIARFEADFDGGMSLRRYVDFALAICIWNTATFYAWNSSLTVCLTSCCLIL